MGHCWSSHGQIKGSESRPQSTSGIPRARLQCARKYRIFPDQAPIYRVLRPDAAKRGERPEFTHIRENLTLAPNPRPSTDRASDSQESPGWGATGSSLYQNRHKSSIQRHAWERRLWHDLGHVVPGRSIRRSAFSVPYGVSRDFFLLVNESNLRK